MGQARRCIRGTVPGMRAVLLSVALLITSYSLLLAGNGLQFVALSLRGGIEQFSTASLGLMTSAYFAGFGCGALYGDRLIGHVGHSRAFAILASVMSAVALAYPLWSDEAVWIGLRLVSGICSAGLGIVVESWLNAASTNQVRGRVLSVYMVCSMGGLAAGPLLSNIGRADGFLLFVLVSILVSLSLVPILMSRADAPAPTEAPGVAGLSDDGMSILKLARLAPFGVVGMVLTAAAQGSFLGLGPVYADQVGLSASLVSGFFSITVLAGLVLQYPCGWISDRIDRRLTILVVTAVCAAAGLILYVMLARQLRDIQADVAGLSMIGAFLAGGITLPIYAMLVAYTNDRIPANELVQAAGALLLAFGVGSSIGPIVAARLMELYGPEALFGFCGGIMAVLALFGLYRMGRRPTPSLDDQTDFVAVSPTTTVLSVDPRYEEEQLSFDFQATDVHAAEAPAALPEPPSAPA